MNGTVLRLLLVGPLPPPSGGMANQTRQLKRLLEEEGVRVALVQTNAPYQPAAIAKVRGVRALFRLLPYLRRLHAETARADVVHVMANSGWSWHLLAAPAVWIARLRGKPVVVNYRGGLAGEFLESQAGLVRRTLGRASALIVPTGFLQRIFARYGLRAAIIPNVVDVERFFPAPTRSVGGSGAPHLVVARNLEQLYGNDVALRAFSIVQRRWPQAKLSVAGSGPELASLQRLAHELEIENAVRFTGRLEADQMASLYQSADVVVNPSRADNTPNSILEALACAVPVVSTNVGGVPCLVEHGLTALLVPPDDPQAMAAEIQRLLEDAPLRAALVENGSVLARACAWDVVREQWLGLYRGLAASKTLPTGTVGAAHSDVGS